MGYVKNVMTSMNSNSIIGGIKSIRWILFLTIWMVSTQCQQNQKKVDEDVSINVSILPQKYFIDRLLEGEKYTVNVVVKPGYNPESYEPTIKQMIALEKASLYLKICDGGFDEVWVKNLKSINSDMKVGDLSKEIELIKVIDEEHGHYHGGVDPHVWISPSTTIKLVSNMRAELVSLLPQDSAQINENYISLYSDLVLLDSLYKAKLSPYIGRTVLVYHPIFSYIERDYGISQVSLEHEGKGPSVKHLKEVIEETQDIQAVFIQKEFNIDNATLLAQEINAELVVIDPLSYDWFSFSKGILDELIKSFNVKQ